MEPLLKGFHFFVWIEIQKRVLLVYQITNWFRQCKLDLYRIEDACNHPIRRTYFPCGSGMAPEKKRKENYSGAHDHSLSSQ